MTVQLEYINHLLQFFNILPIILGLCLVLSVTNYAKNYAGIIDCFLMIPMKCKLACYYIVATYYHTYLNSFCEDDKLHMVAS